jgi:hypothetical protein
MAVSNGFIAIYQGVKTKYSIWQMKSAIYNKNQTQCNSEVDSNNNI